MHVNIRLTNHRGNYRDSIDVACRWYDKIEQKWIEGRAYLREIAFNHSQFAIVYLDLGKDAPKDASAVSCRIDDELLL